MTWTIEKRREHAYKTIAIKGKTPWNKGKKLGFIPKCAFKKGHVSPMKGKILSEERKRQISLLLIGNKNALGHKLTKKCIELLRKKMTGKKHSIESKLKRRKFMIMAWKENKNRFNLISGKDHYKWKGNKVSYRGLHYWVERQLGKPMKCTFCLNSNKNKYDWANISGLYKRELSDWIRLCKKCHIQFDKRSRNRV